MSKKKKKAYPIECCSGPEYSESQTMNFDVEEIEDLKIGQEVVMTVKGTISELRVSEWAPDDEKGAVRVKVTEKTLRKTSNTQAAGIKDLISEDDD